MTAPRHIAVLGGGLTGLSSAFHLSKRFPNARISLIEKQPRLGGWVRSERVNLPQVGASVVLEAGPRTLRPNAPSVLELVNVLGLKDQLITVSKDSAPARARFLYIPPSASSDPRITGLHKLPSSIPSLLGSPLRSILLPAVLREPFRSRNRPPDAKDESIDAFMTRRFGATFAQVFGSALVHGIYAADSRELSVRSAFSMLWEAEERGWGRVSLGMLQGKESIPPKEDYDVGPIGPLMQNVSVYSFRDGMQTLTKALEDALAVAENVSIHRGSPIERIRRKDKTGFEITHDNGVLDATHIASCLPLPVLHKLISPTPSGVSSDLTLSNLTTNPMTSVRVINFVFPGPPSQFHPEGFGYLIPRPLAGYSSAASPCGMLGTVFDSCSLHTQDLPLSSTTPYKDEEYYHRALHTKLTVMSGGPHPLAPLPTTLSSDSNATPPPFVRSLLDELQSHLSVRLPDPVYWRIWNNAECIPTFKPGHLQRVQEMKKELEGQFKDVEGGTRLQVVGAGVGGVSVGDCVEAGKRVPDKWDPCAASKLVNDVLVNVIGAM